jgi:hypothetical protein
MVVVLRSHNKSLGMKQGDYLTTGFLLLDWDDHAMSDLYCVVERILFEGTGGGDHISVDTHCVINKLAQAT